MVSAHGWEGDWLRRAGTSLIATALFSALLFALYILAFYAEAAVSGDLSKWNGIVPRMYEPGTPVATLGIGVHFAAGGTILVLGGIQLVGAVRTRHPALHRWAGRVYVCAALLAGIGGLTFIVAKGSVGGLLMDIGFSIYGALMIVGAVETWRHALARRLDLHRAWALRLFALAIGSWLYRMEYGFWLLLADGAGHTHDFRGAFDRAMMFFYLPNLMVAEAFIGANRISAPPALKLVAGGLLIGTTGLLALGTYYVTEHYWGPAILRWAIG
jgi:hypothetical protein